MSEFQQFCLLFAWKKFYKKTLSMKGIPSSFGYENTFAFMHTSKTAFTFARSLSRLRKRQHSRQKGQNYSSACMKYFTLSITVREKYKVCRRRLTSSRSSFRCHDRKIPFNNRTIFSNPQELAHGEGFNKAMWNCRWTRGQK